MEASHDAPCWRKIFDVGALPQAGRGLPRTLQYSKCTHGVQDLICGRLPKACPRNKSEKFQVTICGVTQRIAKGAGGKGPRQKTSKIVKKVSKSFSTLFDNFRAGQKTSKSVKKFFDTFRQFSRGTFFPAPFAIALSYGLSISQNIREISRPGKPSQRKGQNEKFMNFAHFCEFRCFFP